MTKNAVAFCMGIMVAALAQAQTPAQWIDLIAKAKPSVVLVGTLSPTDNPRFTLRGTGFAVADGNSIVTNAHVLPEAPANSQVVRSLVVQVPGRAGLEMRGATVQALDRNRDLALLKIDGPALPVVALAKSAYAPEGTSVVFIGFPIGGALGYSPVTHRGMVSSVTAIAPTMPTAQQLNETAIRQIRQGTFDIYQIDGTAYPGNSGGPVFNTETGEVIGVINMVFVRGSKESALSQPSGITYAIPVKFVNELVDRR